jgi:hypothetical protein
MEICTKLDKTNMLNAKNYGCIRKRKFCRRMKSRKECVKKKALL